MILGVDPGITGALALYQPGRKGERDIEIIDMPRTTMGETEMVDAVVIRDWLRSHDNSRPDCCFLELVNAMPSFGKGGEQVRMGASSAFKFGDRVGTVRTAIMMMDIPLSRVVPRVWKKAFGLHGSEGACEFVSELLPEFAHLFARKRDHGRADAALIAIYGARMRGLE